MSFSMIALKERLLENGQRKICELVGKNNRQKTFADLAREVDQAANQLRRAGVSAGMRVGFLAENCYEWLVYDLAFLELRCLAVALVPDVLDGNLQRAVETYGLSLLVTSAAQAMVPAPRPRWVFCFDDVDGNSGTRDVPLSPDPTYEIPAWIFSSGSSGRQRCIETSRAGIEALVDSLQSFIERDDRFVVFLPMSNFQQRFLIYGALWFGVDVIITEPLLLFVALKKHQPTLILAPPIFYEAIANRARDTRGYRGWLFRTALSAMPLLRRIGLQGPVARLLSKPIREGLGGRARLMITGMAPTSAATLALFDALDLPLFEAYGMTECGIIARNTAERRRLGAVGSPMAGVSVTRADDGELMVRVAHLPARRYPFDEEATRTTFVAPGVVATGDIGRFDEDGFLYLSGRKNNVIVLPSGAKIHPELVEAQFEPCGAIARSVVLGGSGEGLTVLLSLKEGGREGETAAQEFVNRLNQSAPSDWRIAKVISTDVALSRENGLLTPNLKLNRRAIAARFVDKTPAASLARTA
jgi:long-chain acyl-CoA synthetase